MKNQILTIALLIFSIIVLNSSPLKKFKIKDENKPKETPVSKGETKHSKEYFDKLVEKGLKLDNLTRGHPPYSFYEKINYKEDIIKRQELIESFKKTSNLRRLYEKQKLENIGFVALYQNNVEMFYML